MNITKPYMTSHPRSVGVKGAANRRAEAGMDISNRPAQRQTAADVPDQVRVRPAAAMMMRANDAGSSEAPPTSAPSTCSSANSAAAFSAVTLPP